ncbi:hypothetical protein WHR41_00123 [Cladosporium halotolerans]|uniref:N-acetyltransferase domain-containing protein n=1 Tax=Cladosporium halotolerans TaxID=1052096 RepID=A0AB34L4G6_9PEZI
MTSFKIHSDGSEIRRPAAKIPVNKENGSVEWSSHITAKWQPGPTIDNRPTTATLYQSKDLLAAGQIPGMYDLINVAFAFSHNRAGLFPDDSFRLQSHGQLIEALSADDTFTYVVSYTDTGVAIGVASAKRYHETLEPQEVTIDNPAGAWKRTGFSDPNTEGWELSVMAVNPSLQRKGLAGLLMELVEGEVKKRFLVARVERGLPGLKLVMMLTTAKEVNEGFYKRKGYSLDYETFHGPGWFGSSKGFHIAHMSKQVEL